MKPVMPSLPQPQAHPDTLPFDTEGGGAPAVGAASRVGNYNLWKFLQHMDAELARQDHTSDKE